MNCKEFRKQLAAAIEDRRSLDGFASLPHVSDCAACRQAIEDQQRLDAAIPLWRSRRLEADISARVLMQWRESVGCDSIATPNQQYDAVETSRQPSAVEWSRWNRNLQTAITVTIDRSAPEATSTRRLWPVIVALTGALALAVAVLVRPTFEAQEAAAIKPVSPAQNSDQLADLSDIVEDAKSAWLGLAQSTAARTRGLRVFLPTLESRDAETAMPPEMDMIMDDMPNSAAPVPNELKRAFEFLLDAAEWSDSQAT